MNKWLRLGALVLVALAATYYTGRGGGRAPAPDAGVASTPQAKVVPRTAPARAPRGWSHTRPEINLTHIFHGEINRRGEPVGFHARPGGRDPEDARVVRIQSGPNRAGVYTARVEIRDPRGGWKGKFSSFFPDRLSADQVVEAILHAYRNRARGRRQPWEGPSGRGFRIQGYLSRRGGINTAFPVYRRDR